MKTFKQYLGESVIPLDKMVHTDPGRQTYIRYSGKIGDRDFTMSHVLDHYGPEKGMHVDYTLDGSHDKKQDMPIQHRKQLVDTILHYTSKTIDEHKPTTIMFSAHDRSKNNNYASFANLLAKKHGGGLVHQSGRTHFIDFRKKPIPVPKAPTP
jgi:hypothetical protein